jgi:isopenicillin N synthase-like dioxygenase
MMKPAPSISLINLPDAEERIVGSLESALTEMGFVMVQGHGIPSELVRDVRRVVEGYFSRPAEEKMLDCITPDNYRGYIPLGFFSPNTGGNTPDQYEGYKLHHETSQEHPIRQQCDLYGPNKWPAVPAEMSEVITEFWRACDIAGRHLLKLISRIMGINETIFLSLFDDPLTNMTLLHYPSQPSDRPKVGIHPHKDTDALTLLFPDQVGGLWLQPRGQKDWMEVIAPPDAMVVNIGDLLELWSGGYFVSTPHKVVNASGKERYSFPFFMVPRHDVVVEPLVERQPGFNRSPVSVGPISREVWRTNWQQVYPADTGFDLGTLSN